VSASLPGPRLRPLPRTVTPLHRETLSSFAERLAAANRINLTRLHEHINNPDRIHPGRLLLPHALSGLSGQPLDRLLRALPELREPQLTQHLPAACQHRLHQGWSIQPVCAYCLAAKNITYPARHWAVVGTHVCPRHGRWIATDGQQLGVSALPEVPHAQRRQQRLVRRHGWEAAMLAMREATDLCSHWWNARKFTRARDRRMALLRGPGWSPHDEDLGLVISGYPEIVALAGLLVAPSLRNLPFTGSIADFHRFLDEIRQRAAPDYRYQNTDTFDPLAHWIEQERHRRTLPDHPWAAATHEASALHGMPSVLEPQWIAPAGRPRRNMERATRLLDDHRPYCPGCGNWLPATAKPTAVFCSPVCRTRHWRLQDDGKTATTVTEPGTRVTCPGCGKRWTAGVEHRTNRSYCSSTCRTRAWRQRNATKREHTTTSSETTE
jgi:hypothetical protein